MTVPALTLASDSSSLTAADVLVVGARVSRDEIAVLSGPGREALAAQLAAVGFGGGRDELVRLPGTDGGPSLAVIGLGDDLDEDALRYAAGSAIRQLAGTARVAVDLPADSDSRLGAVIEGAALGSYSYTEYREKSTAKSPVSAITVIGEPSDAAGDDLLARAAAVAGAAALVKDLVNMPPLDLYPETFAEQIGRAHV